MNISFCCLASLVCPYVGVQCENVTDKLVLTTHILKKVPFIVLFCLGKYSFSFDTFWTPQLFWKEINVSFIVHLILVNTASILILFEHTSYFEKKINISFIVSLCPGKYIVNFDTSGPQLVF